jgi:hypothetical protein
MVEFLAGAMPSPLQMALALLSGCSVGLLGCLVWSLFVRMRERHRQDEDGAQSHLVETSGLCTISRSGLGNPRYRRSGIGELVLRRGRCQAKIIGGDADSSRTPRSAKPYSVDDFTADVCALARLSEECETTSPRTTQKVRDPIGDRVSRLMQEHFLDRYGEDRAFDYYHRFHKVLNFFGEHLQTLIALPLPIVKTRGAPANPSALDLSPLFLEFVLAGFIDATVPGGMGTHPLLGDDGQFPYSKIVEGFRLWLGEWHPQVSTIPQA